MIENIAIILLVFLEQLNVISDSQNDPKLLTQFVETESVSQNIDFYESNWNYYNDNLHLGNSIQPLPYKVDDATDFSIKAKAAVAFDVETDTILYSENLKEKVPIASLTKMMTALIVLDNVDLNGVAIISKNAFDTDGRKDGLAVNEKVNAKDLLKIMLIRSNNTAAVSLAEHTSGSVEEFVKLMNEKADLLGLENTNFSNPTGFDSEDNYSTAYDIAQLFDYASDKSLIWEILRTQRLNLTSLDGRIKHRLKNTNLLLGRLKNITGGKTGLTDEAGQCLVLIIGDPVNNHKIISVVLGAEDRFLETEKLVRWVFRSYQW
ncbi:MAG: D-alanyl-D-alanine carboxypeptidase family protein [Patescibacteria group bacterium]|nr:D-alanyl-D-alanine carboxypeptidase family protein [Patescibacteria group bacterium]